MGVRTGGGACAALIQVKAGSGTVEEEALVLSCENRATAALSEPPLEEDPALRAKHHIVA